MGTFNDIRIRFQNKLNEQEDRKLHLNFFSQIKKYFEEDASDVKSDTKIKNGPNLRYKPNDPNQNQEEYISDCLRGIPGFPKFEIETILPRQQDSASGSYVTYAVRLNSNFVLGGVNAPSVFKIVPTVSIKGSLTDDLLSPKYFKLDGKERLSAANIEQMVSNKLETQTGVLSFAHHIFNVVYGYKPTENEKMNTNELKTTLIQIPDLDPNFAKAYKDYFDDLSKIGKNFGEVIGAVLFSRLIGEDSISFMKNSASLVDFVAGGIKVSSKYKRGAAASLSGLHRAILVGTNSKLSELDQMEKNVKDMIALIHDNKTDESYLAAADFVLKTDGQGSLLYDMLFKYFGAKSSIDVFNNIKNLDFKNLDFLKSFSEYEQIRISQRKRAKKVELSEGMLIYLIADDLVSYLNNSEAWTSALSSLVAKIELHQLSMEVDIKNQLIKFAFLTDSVPYEFDSKISSKSTSAGKLSFKMQKF